MKRDAQGKVTRLPGTVSPSGPIYVVMYMVICVIICVLGKVGHKEVTRLPGTGLPTVVIM